MDLGRYAGIVYIISCVIHNVVPDESRLSAFTDDELYDLSQKHSLAAMVGYGLRELGTKRYVESGANIEKSVDWNKAIDSALRRTLLFDAERDAILKHLEETGIWYVPLKGAILKDLYPVYGLREMADNDILYDSAFREELKNYMLSRGYNTVNGYVSKDDVFHKLPLYNFEFHRELFEKYRTLLYEYYKDVYKRLVKKQDKLYEYCFTDEDFYIFLIAHAYKHFYEGGTGLRTLVDIYLYLRDKKLDMGYIEEELEKMKINRFERNLRSVVYKLFGKAVWPDEQSLTLKESEVLTYIIDSGTFGNYSNRVLNRVKKYEKLKNHRFSIVGYSLHRLFPDRSWMEVHNPDIYNKRGRVFLYYLSRVSRAVRKLPVALREVMLAYGQKKKDN